MTSIFFKSLLLFFATVIGAGVFVLPYAASKFGFGATVVLVVVLTVFVVVIHRLLGEVVAGTEGVCSMPCYTEKYLGPKVKNFSLFVSASSIVGLLLVYILIGGKFLRALTFTYFGGEGFWYTIMFFVIGSVLIYGDRKKSALLNINLVGILTILLALFGKTSEFIDFHNLVGVTDWNYFGLLYGIIIFALWGLSAVPRAYDLLRDNGKKYRQVISWGIFVSAVIYLLFALVVVSVSGARVSEEALSGMFHVVNGDGVMMVIFSIGLLVVLNAFRTLGNDLKEILQRDAMLSKWLSWLFACVLPFSLFLIKFRDLTDVMSVIGSFFFTVEGAIAIMVYRKFYQEKNNQKPPVYTLLLVVLLAVILFFEFWYFFIR